MGLEAAAAAPLPAAVGARPQLRTSSAEFQLRCRARRVLQTRHRLQERRRN